jgi:CO/xanthine dehydrogenase FAD-binding subunit
MFVDLYETTLKYDEVLTEILIPEPPPYSAGTYRRFALSEWPTVGVALILTFNFPEDDTVKDAIISLGSVNSTPMRALGAEEAIQGKAIGQALEDLDSVGEIAAEECNPTDDMHASEGYKRQIVKTMVKRGIQEAYNRWMRNK